MGRAAELVATSGAARWIIVTLGPDVFRLAEWVYDRYVLHAHLPAHASYEAARDMLVAMGWASAEIPQSEADLRRELREMRAALERDLGGRRRIQEEVARLGKEYDRLSGLLRETLDERDAARTRAEQAERSRDEALAARDAALSVVEEVREELEDAERLIASMRAGGLNDQEEIKQLRQACSDEAKCVSQAMRDHAATLQREDALLLLTQRARDTLSEVLAALDEAYVATGYSRIAATSQQRLGVEQVIEAIEQLLRASPRKPREPLSPAEAARQSAEVEQQLADLWQQTRSS